MNRSGELKDTSSLTLPWLEAQQSPDLAASRLDGSVDAIRRRLADVITDYLLASPSEDS